MAITKLIFASVEPITQNLPVKQADSSLSESQKTTVRNQALVKQNQINAQLVKVNTATKQASDDLAAGKTAKNKKQSSPQAALINSLKVSTFVNNTITSPLSTDPSKTVVTQGNVSPLPVADTEVEITDIVDRINSTKEFISSVKIQRGQEKKDSLTNALIESKSEIQALDKEKGVVIDTTIRVKKGTHGVYYFYRYFNGNPDVLSAAALDYLERLKSLGTITSILGPGESGTSFETLSDGKLRYTQYLIMYTVDPFSSEVLW
jgi:hypothetical protein